MKLIKNASILDPETGDLKLQNIYFDKKIHRINLEEDTSGATSVYDLQGKLLIPGCIDAHVHFNDPGFTHHEDFYSGTAAAAAGGITTIIDMPCTSIPAVITPQNLSRKLDAISPKALVDFALWGGIRKEDFPYKNNMLNKLWDTGVIGFKIYTISGMKEFQALNYDQINFLFEHYPEKLFAFHAEDQDTIEKSLNSYSFQELSSWKCYAEIRSITAEFKAVQKIVSMMKNNHVHFVHISSKKAAELIVNNKSSKDLTWETCPHYLQFTADDFAELKGKLKTAPSVKYIEDKAFLRKSLSYGSLDFVATDHAGCDFKTEKDLTNFSKVYSGIPGTQLMIPYLFSEFYLKEKVPLKEMIRLTSEAQAKRYGLYPLKGSLKPGTDADFTVIDIDRKYTVDEQKLLSFGKYSPFNNMKFNCSVDKTFVRGSLIFDIDKGIIGKRGFGKWIKRNDK